jgi:deoxyribonuclease-4
MVLLSSHKCGGIRFGPSGNDEKFYAQGYASSADAPKWLASMGLSAYEISFGRGIRMMDKTAKTIGNNAAQFGVQISVHAPYFINLANNGSMENNYNYIKRSLELLRQMGGNRLVVHAGSQMDMERSEAIENCRKNLHTVIKRLDADGISDFLLCIETMGKYRQIGNVEEICELCSVDERVIPTLDFGHINCLMQGNMDIPKIFDTAKRLIGEEKLNKVHIHLSFVQFSAAGEIRHTVLDDKKWGFSIKVITDEIKQRELNPVIICESENVMAQDAVKIKEFYLQENT